MGPNFVPAYQVSGVPFVTASACSGTPVQVNFPQATRFFVITNQSAHNALRVGFTENGINGAVSKNYFILHASSSTPRLELRCKSLFLRADAAAVTRVPFTLVAGLSAVDAGEFPVLTGTLYNTGSDDQPMASYKATFEGVG
jgi:hypothetical protein